MSQSQVTISENGELNPDNSLALVQLNSMISTFEGEIKKIGTLKEVFERFRKTNKLLLQLLHRILVKENGKK